VYQHVHQRIDVTLAQSRLLQRLNPDGMRIIDLAEQTGVTKQTAGALIDQLERNGYVLRATDPAEARARLVRARPWTEPRQPRSRRSKWSGETCWAPRPISSYGTRSHGCARSAIHTGERV
jgi:transposase